MTDPLGQSQVLPYLKGIASSGYTVTLISAEKEERFLAHKVEIQTICDKAGIRWHPVKYTRFLPVISTLFNIFIISHLVKKLHSNQHFQLIHCRSYIPALIAHSFKRKHLTKIIFDMRGFWIDEKIDGNIWHLSNPLFKLIYNFLKKKEKILLRGADAIISLTHKACPIINNLQGNKNTGQLLKVIPCCVDTDHFDPSLITSEQQLTLRNKLGYNENDFILTYVGSLSTWYLPKEMLLFYSAFTELQPQAKFLIITQEEPAPFLKMAIEMQIPEKNLKFISSPRKELPALLSLSDASLFFIKPSFSKIASSPTKLGELLSMGIPVVCNTGIGDTDEIILTSKAGVLCPSFDKNAYLEAGQRLLHLKKSRSKEEIRSEAIKWFSLQMGVSKYLEVYQSLTNHS